MERNSNLGIKTKKERKLNAERRFNDGREEKYFTQNFVVNNEPISLRTLNRFHHGFKQAMRRLRCPLTICMIHCFNDLRNRKM